MAINSPRDIPGLLAWYSAEAVTGLADGGQIDTWTDLSGNNNHATGVVSTNNTKPLWQATTGPSGGPAVNFDNLNGGYFTIPALRSGTEDGEIVAWVKGGTGRAGLWEFGTGIDSAYPYLGDQIREAFGQSSRLQVALSSGAVTTWGRHGASISGDTQTVYRDGTSVGSASALTKTWSTTQKIGRSNFSGFVGHISCVVVYNRQLTTTERADLNVWMAANPSGGKLTSYADEVLADAPLVYWRFDETAGTSAVDSSGNGRNGTYGGGQVFGQAALAPALAGTSVEFAGTADGHVSAPDAPWLEVANFTIEAFIRPDQVSSRMMIASRDQATNLHSTRVFQFGVFDGHLSAGVWPGTGSGTAEFDLSPPGSIVAGGTYHVAMTFDGATVRGYINGTEVGSVAKAITLNATSGEPLRVGGINPATYGEIWKWDGRIDEFAFYGTALSAARIRSHYVAGLARYAREVIADAPYLYHRMGEASGGTMLDSSGAGRNGSYVNTPTLGVPGLLVEDPDTAVDFNGSTQRARTNLTNATHPDHTIEAWVRPDALPGTTMFIAGRRYWTAAEIISYLDVGATNVPRFHCYNSADTVTTAAASTPLAVGQTYHLVGTISGTSVTLYVNGVLAATATLTGTLKSQPNQPFDIGAITDAPAAQTAFHFNGVIDEVAYYGIALSPARVTAHYEAGRGARFAVPPAVIRVQAPIPMLTGAGATSTLYEDNFDRANSTTSVGAPVRGGPYTVQVGTWGILSNQLYTSASTANSLLTVPGAINVDFRARMAAFTNSWSLVVRWVDANNYWWFGWATGSVPGLFHHAGGVQTQMAVGSTNRILQPGDMLRVVAYDRMIYGFVNNVLVVQVEDYWFGSATATIGFRSNSSTTPRFDDAVAYQAVEVPGGVNGDQAAEPSLSVALAAADQFKPTSFVYKGRDTKTADEGALV